MFFCSLSRERRKKGEKVKTKLQKFIKKFK
jgi:hypothetical protein